MWSGFFGLQLKMCELNLRKAKWFSQGPRRQEHGFMDSNHMDFIFTMLGPLSYVIPCSLWVEWPYTLVCPGPVPVYTCIHGVIMNSLFLLSKVSQLGWYIVWLPYQWGTAMGDNQVRGVHSLVPLSSLKCSITYMLSPLINRLSSALSSCYE